MSDLQQARTKLTAARARLILERPFIGALVMYLPLEPASARWCETVATGARAFYFNADYVRKVDFAEVQFVLAHAALHCALGHFARRAHRTLRRWDVACDHAVNLLLIDEGLRPPPGVIANSDFRGLAAEEIYPLIAADTQECTLDRHIADEVGIASGAHAAAAVQGSAHDDVYRLRQLDRTPGEDSDTWDDAGSEARHGAASTTPPRGLSPRESEALQRAWQSRMVNAAQRAREAGRLSISCARLLQEIVQPTLPWRAVLARYMISAARDDYSYLRLSRRDGNAILPRLASVDADVCVAVDTSGSIKPGELAEFAAEVDSLKSQIRARVTLLACDERLDARAPWRFQAWEPVLLPHEFSGGAGTSFVPVFDWVAREHYRPDVLVYFTDAEGDFPSAAPDYPVVWLVKGKARVPWGERIELN